MHVCFNLSIVVMTQQKDVIFDAIFLMYCCVFIDSSI